MVIKGLRWYITGLVGLATVINYIDRNALAVMWPGISDEMGLDKEMYAVIISFFMVAYALGQSAFGKLFDVIGTRLSFVLSIAIWSVSIALHAVAKSAMAFGIFRFTLGFGEAGNWPGAAKSNSEWFPVKERAFAQGLFNAGAALGSVISAPVIAWFYLTLGWRGTFAVIAVLGLLWIIPWLLLYKGNPSEHPWISREEKQHITGDQQPLSESPGKLGWAQLLSYRESWAVILSRFFLDPVWWLFVSWLPIYLADSYGFDVKQIGLFAWVPYVGAGIGSLAGGWFSGKLISRGMDVIRARRLVILTGGIIMFPSLILTAYASTPVSSVLLIAVILFGFQVAIGNIQTLPADYFSGKAVGSLAGIGGTAAVIGVLITTYLVPVITRQSYVPFFILGASLVPFAMLSVFLLTGKSEPRILNQKI